MVVASLLHNVCAKWAHGLGVCVCGGVFPCLPPHSHPCPGWCHKKLIELSAQGVRGQTHPVRNRLAVSLVERRGQGGCDLSIVMMESGGSLQPAKKSVVTRGESGWLANSVTT